MRHFSRLIESHYRQHLPLAEYAKLIGLSVTHLNYLCREFYGCSALGVLHQRLMLEARRNLQYTRMTVTQLSDYLGFSDAAYFSRLDVYKRQVHHPFAEQLIHLFHITVG